MAKLANQLAVAERDEVSRAIRILLGQPMVTRAGAPEAFELIRRRASPLALWFDYYLGWSLHLEPRTGYARLVKVPVHCDPSRPARRQRTGRAPFDRRRYTLFALIAAELVATSQTVIGALAERVHQASAADPVLPGFDTGKHAERVAFVDALLAMESLGVIAAIDGATEAFTASQDAKVLYRVDTTALLRLLAAPTGPSQLDAPDAEQGSVEILDQLLFEPRYGEIAEPTAGADAQDGAGAGVDMTRRNLRLRHRLMRRLFDDPVVYREDLSAAELAYATSVTGRRLMREAAQTAGFVLEERAEGWLVVDTEALATDWKFPDDASNANVAALLVLDRLNDAGGPISQTELRAVAEAKLSANPNWARAYQTPDGPDRLTADALEVLLGMGLANRTVAAGSPPGTDPGAAPRPVTGGEVVLTRLPGAARYQVSTLDPGGSPTPARTRRRVAGRSGQKGTVGHATQQEGLW
jgi:uncharacterized protein (TIGR02678 family)